MVEIEISHRKGYGSSTSVWAERLREELGVDVSVVVSEGLSSDVVVNLANGDSELFNSLVAKVKIVEDKNPHLSIIIAKGLAVA